MRQLHDHKINDFNVDCVRVEVLDEPDDEKGGGACHEYGIWYNEPRNPVTRTHPPDCAISFQHGPVKEAGVNGISQEALLAVVLDRFRSFQRGPFSCRENAIVITKLEEAMMWMHKRTLDRVRRGVEGKHEI